MSSIFVGGEATSANQDLILVELQDIEAKIPALGQALMAASLPVTIASNQSTLPISAASLPLPAGAATEAKQPSLGTAGTASTDVLSIQGIAAMTPILNTITPTDSATNANSSSDSTALEASRVIKASAGRLYTLSGVNTGGSGQYVQVYNSATVPDNGAVPVLLVYVPALGTFSIDFTPFGKYFSTGISVSNSSTAATKTIGAADMWFNAEYK
jgi:hypothetical protein